MRSAQRDVKNSWKLKKYIRHVFALSRIYTYNVIGARGIKNLTF